MQKVKISDNAIFGSCPLFACRRCRTKYGWEHQVWCEMSCVTRPTCVDCRYFSSQGGGCAHPAKRTRKEELPYEEAECAL
ncbi:MAG: hypothetical protein IIU14_04240 [Ruminococcus sp.]|nr:hypothetical protein [Ruminococcus sp.]